MSPSLASLRVGEDEGHGTVLDTQMPLKVSQERLSGARHAELGLSPGPSQTCCADTSPDNFFLSTNALHVCWWIKEEEL